MYALGELRELLADARECIDNLGDLSSRQAVHKTAEMAASAADPAQVQSALPHRRGIEKQMGLLKRQVPHLDAEQADAMVRFLHQASTYLCELDSRAEWASKSFVENVVV